MNIFYRSTGIDILDQRKKILLRTYKHYDSKGTLRHKEWLWFGNIIIEKTWYANGKLFNLKNYITKKNKTWDENGILIKNCKYDDT